MAEEFLAQVKTGSARLYNRNGIELGEKDKLGTGVTVRLNSEILYVVILMGDVDGDGLVTAADARIALRASSRLVELERPFLLAAMVLDGDTLTAADARKILRVSSRLDKF